MAGPNTTLPLKLWEHPDPINTRMWYFMQAANARYGLRMSIFWELHA
jgi:acetoacetyl-CoA synthetase